MIVSLSSLPGRLRKFKMTNQLETQQPTSRHILATQQALNLFPSCIHRCRRDFSRFWIPSRRLDKAAAGEKTQAEDGTDERDYSPQVRRESEMAKLEW
jgi:hypothetical protein